MSRTYVTVLLVGGSGQHGRAARRSWEWSLHLQVSLDDLDGYRRSGGRPETAALHDDADSYLRVGSRRETGKYGVIELGIVNAVLRRAGLPGDLDAGDAGVGRGEGGAGLILGDLLHHLGHVAGHGRWDRVGHRGR